MFLARTLERKEVEPGEFVKGKYVKQLE